MTSRANFSIIDVSNERSSVGVYMETLDNTNYETVTGSDPINDQRGQLQAALEAIIIGQLGDVTITALQDEVSSVPPANNFAQRELKVRFTYTYTEGALTKFGSIEVPTPDLAAMTLLPGDVVDITVAPVSTFVANLNLNGRSRSGQNITVTKAVVVGRNL